MESIEHYIKQRKAEGEALALAAGFVLPTVEHLRPIPAKANPLHHDHFSMGSELVRGWMALHAGYDNPKEPMDLQNIDLVNTRTGQCIRINLMSVYPAVPEAPAAGDYQQWQEEPDPRLPSDKEFP